MQSYDIHVVLQAIVAGIESVDVVPGRCEIIDEGQAFPVIVDEASTPEAFSRLLDMVCSACRDWIPVKSPKSAS